MSVTLKNAFQYHLRPQHFDPKAVPATKESLFSQDVYLELVTLSNITNNEVTITFTDGSEIDLLKDVGVPPKGIVVIQMEGRYCPNGLTWQASAANSIIGYVRGRT